MVMQKEPTVPAAEFKATCLELIDRVRETGVEYVVTKHGRPFAKLVPYDGNQTVSPCGSMKGRVLAYERPFEPVDGDWDVNRSERASRARHAPGPRRRSGARKSV
jgi:prevent-host-death family protein